MQEKIRKFMQGRYGVDDFTKFLMIVWLVLILLSIFFNSGIIYFLEICLILFIYMRIFSKNHIKCYRQNQKYLKFRNMILYKFDKEKNIMLERKNNRIFTCPSCKQKIRIPKGKGKIEITCPKCYKKFKRRS